MRRFPRDLYYVAVKVFLERNGQFLIFRDRYGDWDLPGGRIQRHEFNVPLEKVIARKMREELGSIRYRLWAPTVFMRHERREVSQRGKMVRIFAIGYPATFRGGTIRLSPQHTTYRWVSRKRFTPQRFFRGGWLRGVREYIKIRRNRSHARH